MPFFGSASGFRKNTNSRVFHEPEPSSGPWTFLETLRNSVDLLQGQLLDHLAYNCILGSVDLVFRNLPPGLQYRVNCDLSSSSIFSKLMYSISFLALLLCHPDKRIPHHSAFAVLLAILLCLPCTSRWHTTLKVASFALSSFLVSNCT